MANEKGSGGESNEVPARRRLFRLGGAGLAAGAITAIGRKAKAYRPSSHDTQPRVEHPDYELEGRKLENKGRGMDMAPVWEPTLLIVEFMPTLH